MLTSLLQLRAPQETLIIAFIKVIIYLAHKMKVLPSKINFRDMMLVLLMVAFSSIIPTSLSTLLLLEYISWRIFLEVSYDVCPVCFDRLRSMFKRKI